jgi:hypothetical protein
VAQYHTIKSIELGAETYYIFPILQRNKRNLGGRGYTQTYGEELM